MEEFHTELNKAIYGDQLLKIAADFRDIIDNSTINNLINDTLNMEWNSELVEEIKDTNEQIIKDTVKINNIRDSLLKPINKEKCMARRWNEGYGCQCTRSRINGSMYCKTHKNECDNNNNYSRFGDIDYPYFRRPYNKDTDEELEWKIGHFPKRKLNKNSQERHNFIMKDIDLIEIDEYKKMDWKKDTLYYIIKNN